MPQCYKILENTAFFKLPVELLLMITAQLSKPDLKNLRQSMICPDQPILHHLFDRVCLSVLKVGRKKMLKIAATPHLARNVRVLEYIVLEDRIRTLRADIRPIWGFRSRSVESEIFH